jgi:Bacterial archaeo-eukaryotic release factor family 2
MKSDRLTSVYADPGPFASAYVEVSRDQEQGDRIVELAVRAVCDDLADQGAPSEVLAAIAEPLGQSTGQPAPISRCVVATERGVLLDELTRSHHAQPVATWAPLPDVAAWLRDASQQVPFILALVDHEGGDVTTYSPDDMGPEREASVGEPSKYEHKVRGGGWSHLKMQHTAENVWAENAVEVAAEIERQIRTGPDLVILAGDERSRSLVAEHLPDTVSAEVRVLDRSGRPVDGGDDALAADVDSVLRDVVVARQLRMVHELKERMGRGESVALGVRDVADAFVRGQVDQLMLDPEAAAGFTLRPSDHPGLALGASTLTDEVRADQALIAAACMTDADIAVATAATMGGAPVAGLLRWNQ